MIPDTAERPTILAVDDAPETLSLLSDILENAGMTTLVVRSGASALSLIGQVKPDLILMDALMPKMDGFETCRQIKKLREFVDIPIIFMTGLSDTEHVIQGFDCGGVDYVGKPIVPDELLARIQVHLANARLTQRARIALDISGTPLAAVDAEGRVRWITPEASKLLGRALEGVRPGEPHWRESITPILSKIIAEKLDKAILCNGPDGALSASFIGESAPDEYLIRFSDGGDGG